MDVLKEMVQNVWRYVGMFNVRDGLDILIVTWVVFKIIGLLRKSNGVRVIRGIGMLLAVSVLSELIQLHMIRFVLANTMQIGLLALVIVFQPELRRMLERVGASGFSRLLGREASGHSDNVILQTVSACSALSWRREGALVVFERSVVLDDIIKTGTLIDAEVSAELLKNIFYPKAPLHDGAAVIRGGRLAGAGCMLPLTNNQNLSRDLGMRHRAAIGASENSDALVVVVSEETGSISVAEGGVIKRHLSPETLQLLLKKELMPDGEESSKKGAAWLLDVFKGGRE